MCLFSSENKQSQQLWILVGEVGQFGRKTPSMEGYLGQYSGNWLCDGVDSVVKDRNKSVEAINILVVVTLMKKFEADGFQASDASLGYGWFFFKFRGKKFRRNTLEKALQSQL